MFQSILVVCTGNICRSPIGERLLRQQLPGKQVNSAGILGLEGHPADAAAQAVARRHGVSLEGHIARKVTRNLLQQADLILVMGPEHLRFIATMAPENRGKSLLFDNGWTSGTFPTLTTKVVKPMNMFSSNWEKPVRNGLVV